MAETTPKTDAEYIFQHPVSEALIRLRANVIGQLALKNLSPDIEVNP